jgi:mRNA interferase HigB
MRIIKEKTLIEATGKTKYLMASGAARSWIFEVRKANWENPAQLKAQYRNASLIGSKRVVFNIHGNDFRLIVDVEYRMKVIFIVWFGTHKEYDKIDAEKISYEE